MRTTKRIASHTCTLLHCTVRVGYTGFGACYFYDAGLTIALLSHFCFDNYCAGDSWSETGTIPVLKELMTIIARKQGVFFIIWCSVSVYKLINHRSFFRLLGLLYILRTADKNSPLGGLAVFESAILYGFSILVHSSSRTFIAKHVTPVSQGKNVYSTGVCIFRSRPRPRPRPALFGTVRNLTGRMELRYLKPDSRTLDGTKNPQVTPCRNTNKFRPRTNKNTATGAKKARP